MKRIKQEYSTGYALTCANTIESVFAAKRAGLIGKDELRIFFGRLESVECGRPLDEVVNLKVKRRFTSGQQAVAAKRLDEALAKTNSKGPELNKKLPRNFVRSAARGVFRVSEMLAGLVFFYRRMPQRRRWKSLIPGERYARFTLDQARELTGIAKSTLCEAFQRLRKHWKLMTQVWRPMKEIKRFGPLYVDGQNASLTSGISECLRMMHPSTKRQKIGMRDTKKEKANNKLFPNNSIKGSNNEFPVNHGKKESFTDTLVRLRVKYCPQNQENLPRGARMTS